MLARLALLVLVAGTATAEPMPAEYEAVVWHPIEALPASERQSPLYTVRDPIRTDGLMPEYVLDTKAGALPAYGHRGLLARATSDIDVIAGTTKRQVEGSLKTVANAAKNPVGLVEGLPRGIVNLFRGAAAQVREFGREAAQDVDHSGESPKDSAGTVAHDTARAEHAAAHYADRYLGLSADERAWFERLGVDPYTDNVRLRKAVQHLAHVEAATSLGLRLVSLPSIPYAGDVQRAMDAVFHEDPAVLRERRRDTLLGYGLSADEVDRFENSAALSPTRQQRLTVAAAELSGVSGRDSLFRRAMHLKSEDEADIYVASAELLVDEHRHHPLISLFPDLRLPGGRYADGSGCIVAAAFETITWTATTADAEAALHAGLAEDCGVRRLRTEGTVSAQATATLTSLGWIVQAEDPVATPASIPPASHPGRASTDQ
jgi:hypothetical protein